MISRRCLALALALALAPSTARAITKDDIVEMARAGVSAQIIIETIRSSGRKFKLTPQEIGDLRAAGVPGEVIREMQGAPAPGQKPGQAPAKPSAQSEARRAAEEFRRAEEARRAEAERLHKEAERLKVEAAEMARTAKQAEAQAERRKTEVDAALRTAFERLDRGDYVEAAVRFRKFLRGGLVPPNSYRYVEGEYGLAESLFLGGFRVGALPHFVEVLRRGPVTRRFGPALLRLGEATERIVYDHPIFELLASFDLSALPPGVVDEHQYFLGQFYARFGDREKARTAFDRVSKSSPRYAAARYHLGVLDVAEKKYKTAVKRFEESVEAAERAGQGDVRDLGYLALARVAHENEAFEGAAFYYGKVPLHSPRAARARYEMLWTTFMRNDASRALGLLHELDAPRFGDAFLPDLRVLEATVYVNICRFDQARAAAAEAEERLAPISAALRAFLRPRGDAGEVYRALGREKLPAQVRWALDRDLEFVALRETVRQLDGEIALLDKEGQAALVEELAGDYRARAATLLQIAGIGAQRVLRDLFGEVEEMRLRSKEVVFEVELAEQERLLEENLRLAGGAEAKPAPRKKKAAPPRPAGADVWPFEGEYWDDELDDYRGRLEEKCEE